jgi:hypothetical protein
VIVPDWREELAPARLVQAVSVKAVTPRTARTAAVVRFRVKTPPLSLDCTAVQRCTPVNCNAGRVSRRERDVG